MSIEDLQTAIASHVWYHTIDLGDGVITPGWFDLRPIVDALPWPDVVGKRCLDVGTYDGFLAFELERRGAAEVVAVDISDHALWDWPPDMRATGPENLASLAGPDKNRGFRIAAEALGSSVELKPLSVYDLDPHALGTFDVITCGSLMLHLREPLRALEAIRGVCGGMFLSTETVDLELTALAPRWPVARLNGSGDLCQWWTPNVAGHRRMLFAAGFAIERTTRPYAIPYGESHPPPPGGWQGRRRMVVGRLLAGGQGVPHAAVLARPRL